MKAALDVHYESARAAAACVLFHQWQDSAPAQVVHAVVPSVRPYRAGRFYQRELPCLLAVLEQAGQEIDTIIIDGYVHLRADVGKGLGAYLHEALPYPAVVIGVAKNPLKIADRFIHVLRGRSHKPLYVSAIGCPLDQAAQAIRAMHGPHRLPTMLRLADQHASAA